MGRFSEIVREEQGDELPTESLAYQADATGSCEPTAEYELCSHNRFADECAICEEIRVMETMLRAER